MNCIAIDDEPMALEVIKAYCDQLDGINLCETFTQLSKAEAYLKRFPVDLIFLDIQMPDKNGIEFYKSIEQDIMVVFTTAYSNYAVEGFNVSAVDYLLKPIVPERFKEACDKATNFKAYLESSGQTALYVRSEYALVKIDYAAILYCETMDDYIKIHLENGEVVLTIMSMKKMYEKLPKDQFVRVHRSYVVPIKRVKKVRSRTILLENAEIPIGKSYVKSFQDRF